MRRAAMTLSVMLAASGCTPSALGDAGRGSSSSSGGSDAGSTVTVTARDYCERIVDFFCPFYLRCGRMAAHDLDECRRKFLESCNARYEPRYAMLEDAGMLALNAAGIAQCEAHLAAVPCERQIRDLDGDCRLMWVGQVPAGGPCGIDVEGLVCDPASTCSVSLSLCGECRPAAGVGEACGGEVACGADLLCEDGHCIARIPPGDSCADGGRCVVGATCEQGVCVPPAYVGVGAGCDARNRCVYASACISGRCEAAALQGESCGGATTCATGRCNEGSCVPPLANGAACAVSADCSSGSCVDSICSPLPGRCFSVDGGS